MDEKNEVNGTTQNEEAAGAGKRNTNAPSGWSYSENTNKYETEQGAQFNTQYGGGYNARYGGTQYNQYGGRATGYYSNNGANPYGNSNGYQWDFNRYESAETKPQKKKSGSGKGH